jgi:hypothetical protein
LCALELSAFLEDASRDFAGAAFRS